MSNKERQKDLNFLMLKNTKFRKFAKRFLYSRVIIIFFLILVQILLFIFSLIKLKPYIEYVLGGSILLSFVFLIYLVNKKGKNEFKIAWILPLVIFPLFGIAAYIFSHINLGGIKLKRSLHKVKNITNNLKNIDEESSQKIDSDKENKDISFYLYKQGNYYPHYDNEVKYYPSGEIFFPQLFEDIKNAKEFIFLEFFIIDIDESWTLLMELLEEKVKQGLEVRVLYDAIGSIMASSKSYVKYLSEHGIKAQIFLPLIPFFSTKLNNRNHRKIVVIDGEIAYTGGINITNEYFNYGKNRFEYWKDNAIRIKGPAIQNLITIFIQDWNLQKIHNNDFEKYIVRDYKRYNQNGLVIPYGDDAYNDEDIAEDVYLYIINKAKKYVHIMTPYIVIDNQLQESLLFAAKKGLEVSLIVPIRPDHLITFCIGKTYLKTLIDAGVNIYLYEKGFIHAKTFISDDRLAVVGSINLDYRSLFHHFESASLLCDCPVIYDIEKDFQETLKNCKKMQPEDYKKLPARIRFLGRLFRIFGPLV